MERKTRQRDAIWKAIKNAARPVSPQEILDAACGDVTQLGIATVYRALKAFQSEGMIVSVDLPGQIPRYEVSGLQHHHHFHCRRCDRVFEMEGCAGDIGALAPQGFTVEGHSLSLYGVCGGCSGE